MPIKYILHDKPVAVEEEFTEFELEGHKIISVQPIVYVWANEEHFGVLVTMNLAFQCKNK
jgi:hypothetical protein